MPKMHFDGVTITRFLQVKAISALLTLLPLLCLGIADVDIDIENSNYMLGRAAADAARYASDANAQECWRQLLLYQ